MYDCNYKSSETIHQQNVRGLNTKLHCSPGLTRNQNLCLLKNTICPTVKTLVRHSAISILFLFFFEEEEEEEEEEL